MGELLVWSGFLVVVLAMVLLDLGVFHRRRRVPGLPEALGWTALWVTLALAFNVLVYFLYGEDWLGWSQLHDHALTGRQAALQFFTGYLLEKSLSLDNIFVIAMIFAYFRVPLIHQQRLLLWGVLGAVVLRGLMIAAGAALLARFDWITYLFGGLLIASAVRLLVARHDNLEPDRNLLVRLARRVYPVTADTESGRFFVRIDGRRTMTPLFLALILIESGDLLFAVDSIPAIFAITRDPFLVFTSNVFAILGLRSLYFALAAMMSRFRYLKMSLVFLLAYVGVKMILSHHHPIPAVVSLAVIGVILGVGVMASLLVGAGDPAALASPVARATTFYRLTVRTVRRAFILVAGSTLLLLGAALLVLPGPGLLTLMAGLAVLATEYLWARIWLKRARRAADEATADVRDWLRRHRRAPG